MISLRLWLVALMAASLAAAIGGCGDQVAQRKASRSDPASVLTQRASRLAREPRVATASLGRFSTRSDVRRIAALLARRIPLPTGGNFNGIRWEAADDSMSGSEIDAILQFNAACQWMRAIRDQREPKTARRILALVQVWPAFRATSPDAAQLRRAFSEAVTGGGADALAMLTECDAAHAREARYAATRGRRAST